MLHVNCHCVCLAQSETMFFAQPFVSLLLSGSVELFAAYNCCNSREKHSYCIQVVHPSTCLLWLGFADTLHRLAAGQWLYALAGWVDQVENS